MGFNEIADLKYGDRFIHRSNEYYILPPKDNIHAICYKAKNVATPGAVYEFDNTLEVIHLFEDYTWTMEDDK